ncbi:MAG: hypothetical protein J6Z27_04675 [Bacteroidales bacterium]|nr:hypothetical protein [Bacteroidales bacterium]
MKKLALILLTLFVAIPTFAQVGKYGHVQDSIDSVTYLSYYREYVKQNNLQEALAPWKKAIAICPPQASQNMIVDGQKLIRFELNTVKDQKRRAELIDSLLMLHDVRVATYPTSAVTALNNKAVDIINYKWNADNPMAIYHELEKNIAITEDGTSAPVYQKYMETVATLYKNGQLNAETVMNSYTTISEYMNKALAEKADGTIAAAKQNVETIFADCGVASCDNLITLFTPRYQASPNDKDVLSTIVKLLNSSECIDSDLYLNAVKSLHQIDPSASTAYYLYRLYSSHDQNQEAAETLQSAISMCGDNLAQASTYALELGTFYYKKMGQPAKAVAAAKQSMELDASNTGRAYLLMGTVWGTLKCSGNEIESRAQFWVATDYMNKAKAADPSLTEEANSLSAQYRQYFPQQADAFMYDAVDGQSYTVSCGGMREVTTVRTLK